MQPVIVELKAIPADDISLASIEKQLQQKATSFKIDLNYPLIKMRPAEDQPETYLVRGEVEDTELDTLHLCEDVTAVFRDGAIAPFG